MKQKLLTLAAATLLTASFAHAADWYLVGTDYKNSSGGNWAEVEEYGFTPSGTNEYVLTADLSGDWKIKKKGNSWTSWFGPGNNPQPIKNQLYQATENGDNNFNIGTVSNAKITINTNNYTILIEAKEPEPETYTIYFDNSGKNWTTVKLYTWNGSNNSITGAYPGSEFNETEIIDGKSYLKYTFTSTSAPANLIISNGGSGDADKVKQDGKTDLKFENNGIYGTNGYTGKTYIPVTGPIYSYKYYAVVNGENIALDSNYSVAFTNVASAEVSFLVEEVETLGAASTVKSSVTYGPSKAGFSPLPGNSIQLVKNDNTFKFDIASEYTATVTVKDNVLQNVTFVYDHPDHILTSVMPQDKEGYNLVFFDNEWVENGVTKHFAGPYWYCYQRISGTGNNEDHAFAANVKMEGPITLKVKATDIPTDSNYGEYEARENVYYAYVPKEFKYVLFYEGEGSQTSDLLVTDKGYYRHDDKVKSEPLYLIRNSVSVFNVNATPHPYTVFVTYKGLEKDQDVTLVKSGAPGSTSIIHGQNEKLEYVVVEGTPYYKWVTPGIIDAGTVYMTFKYPGKSEDVTFNGLTPKNYMVLNLDEAKETTSLTAPSGVENWTVTLTGDIKDGKGNTPVTLTYDAETGYFFGEAQPGGDGNGFTLTIANADANYNGEYHFSAVANPYRNGVYNNVSKSYDQKATFAYSSRKYRMVFNPAALILKANWVLNESGVAFYKDGVEVKNFSDYASTSEMRNPIKFDVVGVSDSFNDFIATESSELNEDNFNLRIKAQFNNNDAYSLPVEFNRQNEGGSSSLVATIPFIPVGGKYILTLTFAGNDMYKDCEATAELLVKPTPHSMEMGMKLNSEDSPVLSFACPNLTDEWSYEAAHTVEIDGEFDFQTKDVADWTEDMKKAQIILVHNSAVPERHWYQIEDNASSARKKANSLYAYETGSDSLTDEEVSKLTAAGYKEFTAPFSAQQLAKKPAIKMVTSQNGVLSDPYSVSFATAPGITVDVEEIDVEETGNAEYFTLQGLRVAEENLTPGIYVVVRNGKASKIAVK